MDPGQHPRPDSNPASPYAKDKTWGAVIMALSSLGICCGLGVAGFGGMMSAAIANVAVQGDRAGGIDPATAAFGGLGAFIAIIGFLLVVASILQIVGGVGIMKGRRWGFILTVVFAALSILFHLQGVMHGTGLVGIAINGLIVYYCWARLSGKEGPAPI